MWNLQHYRIVFFVAYIIFIGIFRKCECVKLGRWGNKLKEMKFKPVMKVKPGKIFYQKPMTQELKENDDSTIINAPDKPVVETKESKNCSYPCCLLILHPFSSCRLKLYIIHILQVRCIQMYINVIQFVLFLDIQDVCMYMYLKPNIYYFYIMIFKIIMSS